VALFTVGSAFSQAYNPYPHRENKVLVDFETATTVESDPLGTGKNVATVNTDAQFVSDGKSSLKLDFNEVGAGPGFVINLAAPVDIKGFQILAMSVFVPAESYTAGWYQFHPRVITDLGETGYGPGNLVPGWNHLMWSLAPGTDAKVSSLDIRLNQGGEYAGPVYVDNIRVYKGNFVGLQADEQMIFGFDKPTDKDLFTTVSDDVKVDTNADKQFVTGGDASLKLDLSQKTSGWTNNVARVDGWGKTLDVSKATAIHLDVFIPMGSSPESTWHEIGFAVVGDGGEKNAPTNFVPLGQWVTLEIPLSSDQAKAIGNVTGFYFLLNSGADWTGPVYADSLRAVIPPQ
jgi:hypothetical protein